MGGFSISVSNASATKPQHLPKQRAQCATQEVVSSFFECVKGLLEKTGLATAPDLYGLSLSNCRSAKTITTGLTYRLTPGSEAVLDIP